MTAKTAQLLTFQTELEVPPRAHHDQPTAREVRRIRDVPPPMPTLSTNADTLSLVSNYNI